MWLKKDFALNKIKTESLTIFSELSCTISFYKPVLFLFYSKKLY